MDLDQTQNGVDERLFALYTLEYPPDKGGVASYLSGLGKSLTFIRVVRARELFGKLWPRWLPIVAKMRQEKEVRSILVSHVLPVGTAAMMARRLGGRSYSLFFHGMDLLQATRSPWKTWLVKLVVKDAQALFVNSQVTASVLRRFTDRVPCVITPAVEPRTFFSKEEARKKLGISLEEKIVLAVGRLVPRKGFDVLIEAMKSVDARLVIIGDGPDRERLESLLPPTSYLLPPTSDEERDLWYAAANVFALPIRGEKDDIEGFGIVFLEAALAGLPVVAGKSGGVVEAVKEGETGVFVNPHDPRTTAQAIQGLLNDPERARTMGKVGRERVLREFQWESRGQLVEEAFPLVSVIIPVYNRVHLLDKTLTCLARQTYQYFEVIIVDDGSSEDVERVVQPWKKKLPIRFERLSVNQGGPVARNRGFALSNGRFVLFLDHDARLRRDALEMLVRTLTESPRVDVAYSSHRFGWKLFRGRPFDATALRQGNYIHTTSMMRREAFPGFDPTLKRFQDWDLWLTMSERGSKMRWIPQTLFFLAAGGTMSQWIPSFLHRVPWQKLGWMPERIRKYLEAEEVVKRKHGL